jgi:hypothetical protein
MACSIRSLCIISSALSLATATAGSPTTSPLKLSNPFPPGGGVYHFRTTPNGTHVVYLADQETDGVYELYRVPCAGGEPVKLNGPLVAGGDVMIEFQETPDGSHVIYRADLALDESVELYSVTFSPE